MTPPTLHGIRADVALQSALRSIARHRVRSAVTVLIIAVASTVVVGTTGRTDASRRAVLERLDAPLARIIRVVDRTGEAGLRPEALERVLAMSDVEWAIGLGPVGSLGRNLALGDPATIGNAGEPVGTRLAWGDFARGPLVLLVGGRPPREGEAIAGSRAVAALGLADDVGTVTDHSRGPISVVGTAVFGRAVEDLGSYVLIHASVDAPEPVREFMVLAHSAAAVERLVDVLPGLVRPIDVNSVGIERAEELVRLREALVAEVGSLNAAILSGSLAAAALLTAINVFGAITARRREFGLRRTQGATRSTIAALVLIELAILAVIGATGGVLAGTALVAWQTSFLLEPLLGASIAVLLSLAAVLGTLPAALAAAVQEPLYALRLG